MVNEILIFNHLALFFLLTKVTKWILEDYIK